MKRKRGAIRALILFVVVMGALTLFSRTIYYGTLPKVDVAYATGGTLKSEYSGAEFLLDSDQGVRVSIAADLTKYALRIETIHAEQFRAVSSGDALLTFDSAIGENALTNAERALQRAQEALDWWDQSYLAALNRLDKEIKDIYSALALSGADVDSLTNRLNALQDEQRTLEQSRVLDGVSRLEKQQDLSDAQSIYDQLLLLKQQKWTLFAPVVGLIGDVSAMIGDEYTGLLTIATIIPQGADIRVGIEVRASAKDLDRESVTVYQGSEIPRNGETGWVYSGATDSGENKVLWAVPSEGLSALEELNSLTFRFETERYQYLVPNRAVVGGSIYVLAMREGAFGGDEIYARRIELNNPPRDEKYTAVTAGLGGTDQVIVRWDRPFADGDTVVVPYD